MPFLHVIVHFLESLLLLEHYLLHLVHLRHEGLLLLVSPLDQRIDASWELPPLSVGGERS